MKKLNVTVNYLSNKGLSAVKGGAQGGPYAQSLSNLEDEDYYYSQGKEKKSVEKPWYEEVWDWIWE